MWHKPHLLNALADLLFLIGAAALLTASAVWAVRVPSLPIRQVIFAEELPHTRRHEIEQVLPATLKGNFFSVNLEAVRGALEKLPWVRNATVRRVWPARLEIGIEEHRAMARWGEGHNELVNSYGEVFTAAASDEELAVMPQLAGPNGTAPEVLRRYAELVEALRPLGDKPVALTLSSRLAWQVRLSQGLRLDLGREQPKAPIGTRVQRFVEVYPEAVAQRNVTPAVVDLRYPNGFAMRVAADGKGK